MQTLRDYRVYKEELMEDNFQNQNNNQNGGGYAQYTRPISRREI